jgi:NitT/TauT family transport system ATP-binding protein
MSATAEIVLERVTCVFNGVTAVDALSLEVGRGETVAMVGRTGAGKSTAINVILGSLAPTSGSVRVAGCDPHREFRKLRGKLAISFQTDRLLPWRTALENVALGLQIAGVHGAAARERARTWLGRVKMSGAEDKYPHELSGGMRQRVSLARTLAVDPEIILLDESFSQLDQVTSAELRHDFRQLVRALGKTCLFITHRIEDAVEMADRVIVLAAPAHVVLDVRPGDHPDPRVLVDRIATAMLADHVPLRQE